ncbi:MAG: NifU family protein [Nitrospinaceae bacterium]|jgi:Fe-S cluster biogenesis protein NfuA|nr:NifU family protein [Nitrospinaceae bacterium]|tara:strand:- start:233 stop:826 length:594 start_codon:yes stop_codon:yes gene_type:complete
MQETQTFSVEKIELTPNPRSVKFILNQTVLDEGSKTLEEGGFLEVDAFAHNMFALDIVDMVYLRENFVSVTLSSADLWVIFKDKIKNIIEADLGKYEEGDNEVSASILKDFDMETYHQLSDDEKVIIVEAVLDESVRPALANDGGGLEVIEVDGQIVRIRYQGACGGCPSSTGGTLRVIENHLRSQLDPNIKVHTYS